MQEIGIESSIFAELLSGQKTLEGRLGKPKYIKLRVGNVLTVREDFWVAGKLVKSAPDRAQIQITQLLYFESFEEMLGAVDYRKALPRTSSVREALNTYHRFYSAGDEAEYGVVAITFKLV
ncbi:MAG: ASCH domain-containing protein [Candidatus Saccharimonadales bacterium]|jgi:ASC-1-like (ASCH) protein